MEKYYAIDCFAGCGGLSEGLKTAGFSVLAGIEINPKAQQAHKLNHPTSKLYSDICSVQPEEILKDLGLKKGELDLLAGCPPCQGFSRMRTLNGSERIADPRNKLIFDFVRLAIALQPKTILMENVPGLLKDWRFTEAKRRLKKAGYKWIVADVHDAANFGVPQRRRRMIMMASRIGDIQPITGKEPKATVRNTIGRLKSPDQSKNRLHKLHMNHSNEVMNRIKRIPKNGGSRSALGDDQLECHKKLQGFRDVYGRMKWDDVSPTITRFCHNPSKGRFLHPEQDRAITIYEAMRLQSFPGTYKFPKNLSMSDIASLIGEALPPKFAEAQARHIVSHIENIG
ncbi:MAG: DNA cytosine methyltransferase [Rhodospirillales bacterium]|nr:DNA cytosine methyltransferase [Rhodospirillales bacterium]